MEKISVIIPYHNEEKTLDVTFNLIINQTYKPDEVIFINSSSTDNSELLIDDFIENNNRSGIFFQNIFKNTNTPGGSSNVGIALARNDIVGFMDCGLIFEKDWLEKQLDYLLRDNLDVILGSCILDGIGIVDTACVCHTYGYLRNRQCHPGSLVRKKLFDKIGIFQDRRAGFDVQWMGMLIKNNVRHTYNKNSIVRYNGINFAGSLNSALKKSIIYTRESTGLENYKTPKYTLILFFLTCVSFFFLYKYYIFYIFFYSLLRVTIPFVKSGSFGFLKKFKLMVPALLIVGFFLDLGKLVGSFEGYVKYYFSKKNSSFF